MKRRLTLLAAALAIICIKLPAQEQLGIGISNYGGINALLLNPANSQTLPTRWDANLLAFGHFFDNNYLFLENTRLLDLWPGIANTEIRAVLEAENRSAPAGSPVLDFYENEQLKYGRSLTSVLGPSLLLHIDESRSVGLFTRLRAALDIRDLPPTLDYYRYNLHPFEVPLSMEPMQGSALLWSEIGLNYALHQSGYTGDWSFGLSLKWLQGYESAYARNHKAFNLTQFPDNQLSGDPLHISYGLASTALSHAQWRPRVNGHGLGIDAGVVYTIPGYGAQPYRWRLGASLLDFGFIRFHRSAEQHVLRTEATRVIQIDALEIPTEMGDVGDALQNLSTQLLDNPAASLASQGLTMGLPTGFSAQADWCATPALFINATIVQSIAIQDIAPRRNNLLAITPRLEMRWVEIAAPISWLNWQHWRTGLAARAGWLWFGTDDLASIFKKADFQRTDFYVALKLNPGLFQSSLQGRQTTRKGRVSCPAF